MPFPLLLPMFQAKWNWRDLCTGRRRFQGVSSILAIGGGTALDLAAVEAVVELHVVPAADPQVAGDVAVQMMARQVHAAHVRTVREDAGQARSWSIAGIESAVETSSRLLPPPRLPDRSGYRVSGRRPAGRGRFPRGRRKVPRLPPHAAGREYGLNVFTGLPHRAASRPGKGPGCARRPVGVCGPEASPAAREPGWGPSS